MTKAQKIVFWVFVFLLFFAGVYVLRDVLLPFVAGIVLAYFLDPATTKLEAKLHSRTTAVVIVFGCFVLFCLLALLIILPIVQKQLTLFVENVPVYVTLLWQKVSPVLEDLKDYLPEQADNLKDSVAGHLSGAVKLLFTTVGRLISRSVALLNVLSLMVVTPVVTFYLLRDWEVFCAAIKDLFPRGEAATIRSLLSQMNDILSGFIRGQAMVCLCLGAFYAVGLSLAGLELGLLIGLGIGALSFIPYVGSTTGFVVSVGLSLVQFSDWRRTAVVVVIFFLGQMLEGNFLTPKLVGEKVGLAPVWVMFSLLAGAALFGFLGVLIAVPVAAVIGVLVRFGIAKYKESPLYLGETDG